MQYLIPDRAYQILKWGGLIALPAVAAFVGTVGNAVGWDGTSVAVTVINAAGVLIGALIGASSRAAKPVEEGDEQ